MAAGPPEGSAGGTGSDRDPSSRSARRSLEEIAERTLAGRPVPPTAEAESAIDELCRCLDDPAWPPDLVARPCPLTAAAWHWQQLKRQLRTGAPADAAARARAIYSARWIHWLLAPESLERRPLVSVVIPVHDRARLVREAIDSALAQTHRPVEVIVVDDGSTDGLAEALRDYEGRIRLERQPNRGVSSARNRGVAIARGEYVQFLDSDNLLDPDAIERWIEAFRCVPDADLCYSPGRRRHEDAEAPPFLLPPSGGFDCPTTDLVAVVCRRHPFMMLGVLVPRWLFLASGGFDERLRRGEDTRYWFTLALRGVKVAGLRGRRNEARPQASGLTLSRIPGDRGRVALLNLLDVLERPKLWAHLPDRLRGVTKNQRWRWIGESDEPLVADARARMLAKVEELGRRDRVEGLSPRPALQLCQAYLRSAALRLGELGAAEAFHRRLLASVEVGLSRAPECDPADLAYWLPGTRCDDVAPETLITLHRMAAGPWWKGASPPGQPFWEDLERRVAAARAQTDLPADLVGRPCPVPAMRFHRDALRRSLDRFEDTPEAQSRAAYHALWITALLDPEGPAGTPLVSVVIPAYNRVHLVLEAVASCLAQTYERIETVVVDDGSTDDLDTALRPLAHRIRLLRQRNQGPSEARNLGIRRARGELVHLLDADDLLAPDAVARKVDALRRVPDAGLVFSGAWQTGDPAPFAGEPLRYLRPPAGGEDCATTDLLRVAARRYPFLTSTVLAPRCVLLEAGLFDPALRRGQDSELFYRLGLRDTKAVGLRARSTTRRVDSGSLSRNRPTSADQARVRATCLLHLARWPRHWQAHAEPAIVSLLKPDRWLALASETQDGFQDLRDALLAEVERLGSETPEAIHSSLLVLRPLQQRLHELGGKGAELAAPPFHRLLLEQVERSLGRLAAAQAKSSS